MNPRPFRKLFLVWFLLLVSLNLTQAQQQHVTLILHSGEELPCRIKKFSKEFIYFEAASTRLAFKYGERIEVEKIAQVRLSNGRTLSVNEFLMQQKASAFPKSEPSAPPRVSPDVPPPAPSGPGPRVTSSRLDTTEIKTKIGLRLPEMPPLSSAIHFAEIADLLAEAGVAGKLLYEIAAGLPHGRQLTKSQQHLVEAIPQSAVWRARQRDLQEANRIAENEFKILTRNQPDLLATQFHFRSTSNNHAFLEFVQFLHLENVLHFNDKWQKIETVFGREATAALRDILNHFEDWYYLVGQELEKQ
ncbi:MAG: hypothetical protein ONA90_03465 [candidate division KSB1 bacterium]|nr:hypothetical protein [candidate division KSB1 bacterium]